MNKFCKPLLAGLVATSLLAGCAEFGYPGPYASQPYPQATSQPYPPGGTQAYGVSYGVVDSIQMVQGSGGGGNGMAGSIIGGLIGGLLGSQVGGGNGQIAAAAVGAIGGSVVGNRIGQSQGSSQYQIGVRLDNGAYQTVVQNSAYDLSVGSRVRIENNTVYRY